MKNSLKQLLRTPMKTALFFFLMTAATALLTLGARLWLNTQHKIDAAESAFTTIGTVTQKENATQVSPLWNAATKSYTNYASPVYDSLIDESVLDFSGAEYLAGPERRPYYTSVLPNCQHSVTKLGYEDEWIVAVAEKLMDSGKYNPCLNNIWIIWRCLYQYCYGGISRDSSIPNSFSPNFCNSRMSVR